MTNAIIQNSRLQNLVIFRHGKAVSQFDCSDDFERELVDSGKIDAKNQAQRLKEKGFMPDIVYVSAAKRAMQTWEAAKEVFGDVKFITSRNLYLATSLTYFDYAVESEAANVMIIAHDPGLHQLCQHFLDGEEFSEDALRLQLELTTAGIGWFERQENAKNGMKLRASLRPIPMP